MFVAHRAVTPLRILLVLAAAYSALLLVLSVPGSYASDLGKTPEAAHLLWPMLISTELGILAFLLVVVCTWRLLTMVKNDRIFTADALRWVSIIVWTFVAGWFGLLAIAIYLSAVIFFTPALRDPGLPVMLFGMVLVGAVLVMIVAVLRSLLRRATVLQTDLDGVI